MRLPKQLEILREQKIWLCHPLIFNPDKHGGVGGFDKPPINPHTLYPGASNDHKSLATFEEAAAQLGKTAYVRVNGCAELKECIVEGIGISFSGTGILGLDMDNVVDIDRRRMTSEAHEIMMALDSYTEISPSSTGLHILFIGNIPKELKKLSKHRKDIFGSDKAEYQLFDSGYMTVTGTVVHDVDISERSGRLAMVYDHYFKVIEPIYTPSIKRPEITKQTHVSASGFTYERWLEDVRRLSDAEILDGIFRSGSLGKRVRLLYNGDTNAYGGDHSRADLALCSYLYGFTDDREITERLFRSSQLFRSFGKSRSYMDRTLNKAASDCVQLTGHIVLMDEEKREYKHKSKKGS